MKNLLIAAIVTFFVNVYSVKAEKSEPSVSIQEIGNFQFKIDFEDNNSEKAYIEVINEEGNVYFQGNYNTAKPVLLNFTNLTDGKYTISVNSGKDKTNHTFEIQNHANKVVIAIP